MSCLETAGSREEGAIRQKQAATAHVTSTWKRPVPATHGGMRVVGGQTRRALCESQHIPARTPPPPLKSTQLLWRVAAVQ